MTYQMLAGTRAPVRVWTDPWSIGPEAARQLRNIGALPWVEGVAVMPDVHCGKGATVGSVIAMRQALAPAEQTSGVECRKDAGWWTRFRVPTRISTRSCPSGPTSSRWWHTSSR